MPELRSVRAAAATPLLSTPSKKVCGDFCSQSRDKRNSGEKQATMLVVGNNIPVGEGAGAEQA